MKLDASELDAFLHQEQLQNVTSLASNPCFLGQGRGRDELSVNEGSSNEFYFCNAKEVLILISIVLNELTGSETWAWKWEAMADLSGPVNGNKETGLELWPRGQESLILPHLAVFVDTPAFY